LIPSASSIQHAQVLIAAVNRDWGEARGNYDELRFFTGLRPSEARDREHSSQDPGDY
jgi:hypothetical protein